MRGSRTSGVTWVGAALALALLQPSTPGASAQSTQGFLGVDHFDVTDGRAGM